MKKNVRCAVIGQHPLRFPWGFDEEDDGCRRMKLEMAQRIMEDIMAICLGVAVCHSSKSTSISENSMLGKTSAKR